jgi:hypothetical protein
MTAPVSPSAPVAWQTRVIGGEEWFTVHSAHEAFFRASSEYETRPLYASPAPSMVGLREKVAEVIAGFPKDYYASETVSPALRGDWNEALRLADQCLALLAREGV